MSPYLYKRERGIRDRRRFGTELILFSVCDELIRTRDDDELRTYKEREREEEATPTNPIRKRESMSVTFGRKTTSSFVRESGFQQSRS